MTDKNLTEIGQFRATALYHSLPLFRKYHFTDGIYYMAHNARAYWLLERIFVLQDEKQLKAERFQTWKLQVKDHAATLIAEDGNYNELHRESIPFTDFPLSELDFYFIDNVLLLKSEY